MWIYINLKKIDIWIEFFGEIVGNEIRQMKFCGSNLFYSLLKKIHKIILILMLLELLPLQNKSLMSRLF